MLCNVHPILKLFELGHEVGLSWNRLAQPEELIINTPRAQCSRGWVRQSTALAVKLQIELPEMLSVLFRSYSISKQLLERCKCYDRVHIAVGIFFLLEMTPGLYHRVQAQAITAIKLKALNLNFIWNWICYRMCVDCFSICILLNSTTKYHLFWFGKKIFTDNIIRLLLLLEHSTNFFNLSSAYENLLHKESISLGHHPILCLCTVHTKPVWSHCYHGALVLCTYFAF